MEVNKVKKINVSIKIWTSGDYVYFNNTEAVKYVWGATTIPGDMKNQGMERIMVKDKTQYRVPIARLESRLEELETKRERVISAIGIIKGVLREVEK